MAEKWAYTHLGRLARHDNWSMVGTEPFDNGAKHRIESAVRNTTTSHLDRHDLLTKKPHTIAFDGEKWLVGYHAYPEDFLDPAKFPPDRYNYELKFFESRNGFETGRPCDQIHSYISESADFPETIPNLDKQKVAALHEANIIPRWEKSIAEGRAYSPERTTTSFEPLAQGVSITEHLPEEAVAALRKAHSERKPIAIRYDAASKEWTPLNSFENQVSRMREMERKSQAERISASRPSSEVPRAGSAPSSGAAEEIAETGKTFTQRFRDMHPAGKTAIVGGSVALAALVGYWVYKVKHQDNPQRQQSTQR